MKTLAEAIAAITALQEEVGRLRQDLDSAASGRARGPKVERSMTEADAFRVKYGDLSKKVANHKQAAAALGLSYGQVFSCRGGYTFKHVRADWKPKDDEKPSEEGGAK